MAKKRGNSLLKLNDIDANSSKADQIRKDLPQNESASSIVSDVGHDIEKEALIQQNHELVEKLATYLDQIEELKSQIQQLESRSFNTVSLSSNQEESDKYLTQISELTFENAKLRSQLADCMKNSSNSTSNSITKQSPKQSTKVSYYNQFDNNGYSDWN